MARSSHIARPPPPTRGREKKEPAPNSLDHFIRPPEQRDREGEAERLGGLHVDDQLDARGLLHWQVGRLFALEDAAGVGADQAELLRIATAIAHQSAGCGKFASLEDR